jgi:SPP1 gp7 family putative phage head morphogenesis protein
MPVLETLAAPSEDIRKRLSALFTGMMRSLFKEKGAEFRVHLVADPAVQEFVSTHASAMDSAFEKVSMTEGMRRRLTRSNYIFSGMKAFHELHEAFPSLLDENGNRKPFERFLNDVQSIDSTYNGYYLRAEYNFVSASAEMAERWERFMRDGDRYNLQYRTQRDDKVRPEHAALDRVTLPPSDSFWEEFYPPNGWNCRCTVVQVRKSKYPATSHDEAMRLGDEALQRDTKGIFRFNAGKEGKSVPDYNPYTIRRCTTCPVAKDGKSGKLAAFIPDNEVCKACVLVHRCEELRQCKIDPVYGERLKTSTSADKTEVMENTRASYSLLSSFPTMEIKIREHVIEHGVKNPEYLINGLIGDRKGIRSVKGVTAAFRAAKEQGCEVVVIDLDMWMSECRLNLSDLARRIFNRQSDFISGAVKESYVILHEKAVRIGPEHNTRETILQELQKIKP